MKGHEAMVDLVKLCVDLVSIPSVSHEEERIASFIETYLAGLEGLEVTRIGNNIVGRRKGTTSVGDCTILAGHIDTVPPAKDHPFEVLDGRITALGAADMKGGIAILLALAETLRPRNDVVFIFYAREEIDASLSGLRELYGAMPSIFEAQAGVLLEPTGTFLEAGCQGTLRFSIKLAGKRAHTARPWMGRNAIARTAPILQLLSQVPVREIEIDGCIYKEALSPVRISGGVANNVVPDEAVILVNHRFAPDRSATEAFQVVHDLLAPSMDLVGGDELVLEDSAPGALPRMDVELFKRLSGRSGGARAKLGWTDVSFLSSLGIPATNFGPGDPELAHSRYEWVDEAQLVKCFSILSEVLT